MIDHTAVHTAPPADEDDREALARALAFTTAPALAAAVHRHDRDAIAALIWHLDPHQLRALAVVLANQITIDDIAVERAADGENILLTWAERAAAVHLLLRRGHNPNTIGRRLRLSGATATRLIAAVRHQQQGAA